MPLARAAEVRPVVSVTGARQTGKSTLVSDLGPPGERLYVTLDDIHTLGQARAVPDELIARAPRMTIDEIRFATCTRP